MTDKRLASLDELAYADTAAWFSVHVWTPCPGCGHAENLHVAGMCYGPWGDPIDRFGGFAALGASSANSVGGCTCEWSIEGTKTGRRWVNHRTGEERFAPP